jgi:hypothetical protein
MLAASELKLRNILPGFPTQWLRARRATSADVTLQRMMRIRGEIRGDSDKLRSELAAVCRFQEFLRQKIADDEDAWADGRRQLSRPVDPHVVKAVRATRVRLEKELGERGASVAAMGQVKRIGVNLAAVEKQMNAELDRSFAIRGLNNVLASLFLEREKAAVRLGAMRMQKVRLEWVAARRGAVTEASEASLNALTAQLRENDDFLASIESLREGIAKARADVRRRQFKNAFQEAQHEQLDQLRSRASIDERHSNFQERSELLTAEFERDWLVLTKQARSEDEEKELHGDFEVKLADFQREVNAVLAEAKIRVAASKAVMKGGQAQNGLPQKIEQEQIRQQEFVNWVVGIEAMLEIEGRENDLSIFESKKQDLPIIATDRGI